jgi:hypothetical protein
MIAIPALLIGTALGTVFKLGWENRLLKDTWTTWLLVLFAVVPAAALSMWCAPRLLRLVPVKEDQSVYYPLEDETIEGP